MITNRNLKRSGSNLTAEQLVRGEILVLRPLQLYLASFFLIGAGLFLTLTATVFEADHGRLFAVLEAGLVPGSLVVGGVLTGPMVYLKVAQTGVMVSNPFRTAEVSWDDLIHVRVGAFGVRLVTKDFEAAVFAAQSNNWEEFRESANQSVEILARRLMEVRDEVLVARSGNLEMTTYVQASVKRWRSPWPAVVAVSAYTLLVGLYVYLW